LRWHDFRLTVETTHAEVIYTVRDGQGAGLTIRHAGQRLDLTADAPTTVAVRPRKPMLPPPPQPPGREPMRRGRQA
jgi:alpha,alpha-trehalose phosphorylase